MAKIIRAEFLSYYNSAQNSDKVFNVFLIEEDNGKFSCVTEYGRRGNKLVQRTLCTNETRSFAEGKLRQKILAKRNHSSTPYSHDQFGSNYSCLAQEYEVAESDYNSSSKRLSQTKMVQMNKPESDNNVIQFPYQKRKAKKEKPGRIGILNEGQFDSLEI